MQKIISLFQRNYEGDRLVRDEIVPGAEWVTAGEGIATRKWDGTCCAIINGKLYKRCEWDAAKGNAPASFIHWDRDREQRSGHGWLPVGDDPGDWMHRLASIFDLPDGTYELIGPKINGNPENVTGFGLVPHGKEIIENFPRTYGGIKAALADGAIEGVVWHHPDGRMAKIKAKDFGIKRAKTIQNILQAGGKL